MERIETNEYGVTLATNTETGAVRVVVSEETARRREAAGIAAKKRFNQLFAEVRKQNGR